MNSGKTTQLLQAHYNYRERGMNPYALTARIDERYGSGKITARIGLSLDADTYDSATDIQEVVAKAHAKKKIDAVFIDEAQFLTAAQVLQCADIVDRLNIPVLCYGLKTDFLGRLFEGSQGLLSLADNIEEIKALCWCGRKATHSGRIDSKGKIVRQGELIQIGGNDVYVSLCRKHFLNGKAKRT